MPWGDLILKTKKVKNVSGLFRKMRIWIIFSPKWNWSYMWEEHGKVVPFKLADFLFIEKNLQIIFDIIIINGITRFK